MKKRKLSNYNVLMMALALVFGSCTNSGTKDTGDSRQEITWHQLMMDSEMKRNPEAWMADFEPRPKWNYTHGLLLKAATQIWKQTGDEKYFNYIKAYYDEMIDADGKIGHNYRMDNFNIDHVKPGINLIDLYEETGDERYLKAMQTLREQLTLHPRTSVGAYWHKKIYPNQIWLDGVYMNTPFYTRYGVEFNEPANFEDVMVQINQAGDKTFDAETGLLYHAWDESRVQGWSDPETGHSPHFWGRAMGWYCMALVDVAGYLPADHPGHADIKKILTRTIDALAKYQDPKTGLWYQVVNLPEHEDNYLESSVSSMVAYTIAKGVNLGILDKSYFAMTEKAWNGLLNNMTSFDDDGLVDLNNICAVAGLGGDPYRDGSFEYYISEPIRSNDPKGVGPFMLLSMEMEKAGIDVTVPSSKRKN
jgi:unsaturated rhamnogalacturonyl hydrolase